MNVSGKRRSNTREFLCALLPIITWLPRYERTWLRTDIMAGLAVWAMTVPQALAYAGIAGVPPVYGLYAVPLAMVVYAVFGTSRTLSVGPESAIAIISSVTVGALVVGTPNEFIALTSLLTLIVGVLFLVFGLLRLGWAANFLSQPVLQGFTQGIALIVIIGQIPKLFGTETLVAQLSGNLKNLPHLIGLEIDYTGFFLQAWALVATLGEANLPTTAVGIGSLALLFALRRFWPLAPSALIAVILSVLAVSFLGLAERGVGVVGEVETGMVSLTVPSVSVDKLVALLPGAFAIVLLGYSVSLSVAAVGAETTGEEINPNQELVGLGVANLGAALSSGFVVCGSLSRGVVIRRAGGQTQVVSLINAALIFLTLLFVLPLFFKLPNATLSAVVIQAMLGLLNFAYLRKLFRIDRSEFAYAMAALFGVLVLGILQGVALGVVLSLAVLIRRVSRPATAVLGRLPGTNTYRNIAVHPKAETIPGLLVFRFDAPIIFANAGYFADEVRRLIANSATPVHGVMIPSRQINQLDSTGASQLERLHAELNAKGIVLSFVEVKSALREALHRTGIEEKIGVSHFYESIEDGVQAFLRR
ncbi:MAG TPA: sulfate permease [Desulfobacterales bacterium]|nr:sulfate permease [Desulfobacterales bacterium]